ncbi:exonuclease 3'-5' domain-containing protein 2-like [Glossina fuscipes fuscipes]
MLEIEGNNLTATKTAIVAGAGIGLLVVLIKRLLSYLKPNREDRTSDKIVNTLKSHCSDYVVLGFDCQWITGNNGHKLVALLQLATVKGFCAVFRLPYMQPIPHSLKNLLKDKNIIKVGVDCVQKAQQLTQTYGIKVLWFDTNRMIWKNC